MYKLNDVVVYGTQGVCRITEIGPLECNNDQTKLYYTLCPLFHKGTILYAPVDNRKSVMRPLLSQDDIDSLIDDIPTIHTIEVKNDRERESLYKSALLTCDPRELVKVIKTVYFRRKDRLASGKKRIVVDEKYYQLAEEQLYQEMAYVLNLTKDDMESYISEKVAQ